MVAPLNGTGGRNQKSVQYQALSTLPIALPIDLTGVSLDLATQVQGILPVVNGGTGTNTSTGSGSVVLNTSPTIATSLIMADGANIVVNATTGTQIGTATAQKISLWAATPNVQPTNAIVAAAFVANTSGIVDDSATFGTYTIGQVVAALQRVGILA